MKTDETTDDSFFYLQQFGPYLQKINCGNLKVSAYLICQRVIYCYVAFLQSTSVTC